MSKPSMRIVGPEHARRRAISTLLGTGLVATALLLAPARLARGQEDADSTAPPPAPQTIDLKTKDGLDLKATFYGSNRGRAAVPVLMLHGHKGKRTDFDALALQLQQAGHAVLVPDLRGHGDSTTIEGSPRKLTADSLPANQYPLMVQQDVEQCKQFLMGLHNKGELNIEKLCVVGADMGAAVALLWSKLDWGWPALATGKQGQDVRALVLLSPPWTFKTLKAHDALADPHIQRDLSVLIVAGKGKRDAARDAQRIYDTLSPFHPEPPEDKRREEKDLFMQSPDTSLQGTQLLAEMPNIGEAIARFIELRLVEKDIPWKERKRPLQP